MLFLSEVARAHAQKADEQKDRPNNHVQAVEPGRHEER
jgi:hypothetical protein